MGLGTEIGNCHFNWSFSVVTYSGWLSRDTVKRTPRCEMVYSDCLSRKMIVCVTKQLKAVYLMLGTQPRHWITAIVVMNESDIIFVIQVVGFIAVE